MEASRPPLLSRLTAVLVLVSLGSTASAQQGTITYVAREELKDAALVRELAAIGGEQAQRFELALGEARSFPDADRVISPRSREAAEDEDLCRSIEAAEVLVLRGGDFLGWYETVYPRDGRTRLGRSLRRFLQTKRPLVAYGGACAFLSGGVSVPKAELDEVERNPRRQGETYTERVALGVGPRALFDCSDWTGGEPIRLLRGLHRTRVDLGLFLVGEVALRYSRDSGTLELRGPGSVLAFELSRAKRSRERVDRARLHRWTSGDAWDFGYKRLVPGPGKRELERGKPGLPVAARSGLARATARDLSSWLALLATKETDEVSRPFDDAHWILRWDSASRRLRGQDQESILSVELAARWKRP